jgi:hypothetical protein
MTRLPLSALASWALGGSVHRGAIGAIQGLWLQETWIGWILGRLYQ